MIAFGFAARRDTLGDGNALLPQAAAGQRISGSEARLSAANRSDRRKGGRGRRGLAGGTSDCSQPGAVCTRPGPGAAAATAAAMHHPHPPTPPASLPLPHPGLPAPPPRFAGFGEGGAWGGSGSVREGMEDRPSGRNDSAGDGRGGWGRPGGRKLGETVQAEMGVAGGGAAAGGRDSAGERAGGSGRAGAAGCFPLVRAGCRETRGPMSAHQLSPAPSACPYKERPPAGARAARHIRAGT